MKILFLQYWYDLYGGIETVNDTLAGQFTKDGYDTTILCLWQKGKDEHIYNNNYKKLVIGNEPVKVSRKEMLKDLSHLKIKNFSKKIKKHFKYHKDMSFSKRNFSKKINEINPDFIIVSNPTLIELVPKKYLKKSVIHMHSGLQVYNEDKDLTNLVLKYSDKVNRIIWLTPNFAKAGKKMGFTNSTYMSNPVRIVCDNKNNLDSKKITFIGRLCDQKRPELLADIFNESSLAKEGWTLQIYGTGEDRNINSNKNVLLLGGTNDVKGVLEETSVFALTSWHEGFPMVILEAYECGVPVIVYDYGVSTEELVIDGKTGYVIELDDKEKYIEMLEKLCLDKELRQKMGNQAKEFVKDYYPEKVVKRWYKLFENKL